MVDPAPPARIYFTLVPLADGDQASLTVPVGFR
jgi:hypothetical protein